MPPRNGERDLVGYGRNPPNPEWPDGARVALNFVLNIEEASEYSIGNGDGYSEATLTEVAASWVPRRERDRAAESMFEDGSSVSGWRGLRLFPGARPPNTMFGQPPAIGRAPAL